MSVAKEKSKEQVLFEQLRHLVASTFTVPKHMTVWELEFISSMIVKIKIEDKYEPLFVKEKAA